MFLVEFRKTDVRVFWQKYIVSLSILKGLNAMIMFFMLGQGQVELSQKKDLSIQAMVSAMFWELLFLTKVV